MHVQETENGAEETPGTTEPGGAEHDYLLVNSLPPGIRRAIKKQWKKFETEIKKDKLADIIDCLNKYHYNNKGD